MFQSISNSWNLFKASSRVLLSNTSLLIFPVVSSIVLTIVSVVFIVPSILVSSIVNEGGAGADIVSYMLLFVFYLVSNLIIFYFNTALTGAVMEQLNGRPGTVGRGLGIATGKLIPLLGYALIASTVGVILSYLRDRGGLLGNILGLFGGLAWQIATFLVVPVLVVNNVGPIQAIKTSSGLLRRTWGEQIVGNIGLGVFNFLGVLVVMLFAAVFFVLAFAGGEPNVPLLILGGLVMVVGFLILGIVTSALNAIYRAILYKYAAEGANPFNFDANLLQSAFRQKR